MSVIFYAWGEPKFVFWVFGSALFDWLCGNVIASEKSRMRRVALAAGVLANLALLAYFKYANFFADTLSALLAHFGSAWSPFGPIALPIGVSFIVFEKITYLVDLYKRTGMRASAFDDYLLYVFFFPKLLAGPIIKYHDIADQLVQRRTTWDDVEQGFLRFAAGLAKKIFIADTMSEVVEPIFSFPAEGLGPELAWIGIIGFTLQIYFDFSGYSDMAIGLGRIFGFRLRENFNHPYIATSFTDFWHRWHISLSSWIREYLYYPLGGNRKGRGRAYFNLWLCFLLSGWWHGASWKFIVWGAYHGMFLIFDKVLWLEWQKRSWSGLPRALTLFFIMVGWVFFRAKDFNQALHYLQAMAGASPAEGYFVDITPNVFLLGGLGIFLSLAPGSTILQSVRLRFATLRYEHQAVLLAMTCLFVFSVAKAVTVSFNPFLYFRF